MGFIQELFAITKSFVVSGTVIGYLRDETANVEKQEFGFVSWSWVACRRCIRTYYTKTYHGLKIIFLSHVAGSEPSGHWDEIDALGNVEFLVVTAGIIVHEVWPNGLDRSWHGECEFQVTQS